MLEMALVGELGSIFEADRHARSGRPRGPDLRVTVDVPRQALGAAAGFVADIPTKLEHAGELVERAASDDGPGVRLHLPESLPQGAILRLRGQGGIHPEGVAGDLMVQVQLVEAARRTSRPAPQLAAIALVIAMALALVATLLR